MKAAIEYICKLADLIIPAGDRGEPPASQSRTPDFVQEYLESGGEFSGEIRGLLEELEKSSLTDEAALREVEIKHPESFRRLVELIYTSYYGDPQIVKKLGLPGPPQPQGHSMEPFDANLLKADKNAS